MTAAEKPTRTERRAISPAVGIAAALILIGVAFAVPPLFGWHVNALGRAPLSARWDPRVGRGTVPAVALVLAAARWAPSLAMSLRWSRLLLAAFAASLLWATCLAMVDGTRGIGGILGNSGEYLQTAHQVHDVPSLLHGFVARIPLTSRHNWPTHVAGHPPGALLFFVLLVQLGLGGGLAAGWTVVVIAATTAPAVLITLRRLGAEQQGRQAAPFLVFGPSAIWLAVSADAMFGTVAAWGLCCLALAATSAGPVRRVAWGVLSGVLLGYCCFLSYGLPLLAVLAAAIVVMTRSPRVLLAAGVGVLAVFVAFALGGFTWWHAYPVLRTRYYAGIAHRRPASYWLWGDLAALCLSAGPVLGASIVAAGQRLRTHRIAKPTDPAIVLTLCAAACIVLADASQMSKGETERIWLPFVPWLLLGTALLTNTWRRRGLALQLLTAVTVQSLMFSRW